LEIEPNRFKLGTERRDSEALYREGFERLKRIYDRRGLILIKLMTSSGIPTGKEMGEVMNLHFEL
jgi:hypothetical protein